MRPKLGTVFPEIIDSDLAEIEVEHIVVSKERRSVNITFPFELKDELSERISKKIKDFYKLERVNISCMVQEQEKDTETKVYAVSDNAEEEHKDTYTPVPKERVMISDMLYGRGIRDYITPLNEVKDDMQNVAVRGQIFGIETKDIKSKKTEKEYHLVLMDITDFTDSISVQLFMPKTENDDAYKNIISRLKKGTFIAVKGKAQYNDYAREIIISANSVAEIESFKKTRKDNSPKKRVELHLHTQMSAMDAVSSAKDLIGRAVSWEHTAIAITDHGVVQSYPDAMKASSNSENIKVIYGVEGYLVDDNKLIQYGLSDEDYNSSFVVFDLETTGLNREEDKITEIGAVKIENGVVVDSWSSFINPEKHIPEHITELTSITDEMVANAP